MVNYKLLLKENYKDNKIVENKEVKENNFLWNKTKFSDYLYKIKVFKFLFIKNWTLLVYIYKKRKSEIKVKIL